MKILGKTIIDKDFKEISFSELLAITGGIIAGTFLSTLTDNFGLMAGLFILFPGLLEMHGNIYGSLSARLSNLLLLNKLKNKKELMYFVGQNILASFLLLFFVSLVLGITSYLFIYFVFEINNYYIILISVLSSLLCAIIEMPFTIYTTLWLFKHNFDPEDIMGPYVTTLGDILSIVSLIVVMGLFL